MLDASETSPSVFLTLTCPVSRGVTSPTRQCPHSLETHQLPSEPNPPTPKMSLRRTSSLSMPPGHSREHLSMGEAMCKTLRAAPGADDAIVWYTTDYGCSSSSNLIETAKVWTLPKTPGYARRSSCHPTSSRRRRVCDNVVYRTTIDWERLPPTWTPLNEEGVHIISIYDQ